MATYYIRSDGSDSNTGTADTAGGAWLTIEKAFTELIGSGGHTINLGAGTFAWPAAVGRANYPTDSGSPSNVFTDWVDFVGASNTTTIISGSWILGGNAGEFYGTANIGSWDAYFRIIDCKTIDEVFVYGARYLEFNNCLCVIPSPWNGSSAAIDRQSIFIRGGRYISIDASEFTDTSSAIAIACWDSEVTNNAIHDISHDGIRIVGSTELIVDSNQIYNLDDGADDIAEPVWSRHNDCIHVYMAANTSDARNVGVTISNNLMYNSADQALQFNNYKDGSFHNSDFTFFNNIFGQTRANTFNGAEQVDGFLFYNNTFILSQTSNSFTSSYRTVTCDNITFTVASDWTGVEIYNNLLANSPPSGHDRVANNVYQARDVADFGTTGGGKDSIFTVVDQFVDSDAFTGTPITAYVGKNLGTRLTRDGGAESNIPLVDYHGTARDNRPDMGAYEFAGESPPAETPFSYLSDTKTVFTDNFNDGDPLEDIELGSVAGQRGIAWNSGSYTFRYDHTYSENEIDSPQGTSGPYFAIGTNITSSDNVTISYNVRATASAIDDGTLLFYFDASNYIYVSITRTAAGSGLRLVAGGIESTINALSGFTLGNLTTHLVEIEASHAGGTLTYSVNLDSGTPITGTADISSMATIGSSFGLIRDSATSDHRLKFDDYTITLVNLLSPAPLRSQAASNALLIA
tara:strand:- start:1510 stop:3576 length:2067 start_codon:yes stop_codon:yes gene_type:complete